MSIFNNFWYFFWYFYKNTKKSNPRNIDLTTFLGYYYKLTYATFHLVRD